MLPVKIRVTFSISDEVYSLSLSLPTLKFYSPFLTLSSTVDHHSSSSPSPLPPRTYFYIREQTLSKYWLNGQWRLSQQLQG